MGGCCSIESNQTRIYKFQYRPLKLDAKEFRLIRLLPAALETASQDQRSVECELFHASLDTPPEYKALSYTWGNPADGIRSISINGDFYEVRENLWQALLRLQSEIKDAMFLWVDAVCIDQANVRERNHQVSNMRTIYERASQVIIWLGLSEDESGLAIALVADLSQCRHSREGILARLQHPEIARSLKALAALFQRRYWWRIWIVQEVVLGKNAVVYCGDDAISFSALSEVQDQILMDGNGSEDIVYSMLADDLASKRAIFYWGPRPISTSRDAFLRNRLSLFEGLQWHFDKRASDPRDMIYGLVGLTDVVNTQGIVVDYSRTIAQVYTDFATYEIGASRRLNILTRLETRISKIDDLPSWVPDWSGGRTGHAYLQDMFRPMYHFKAAGDSQAHARFSADTAQMTIMGLNFGKIKQAGQRSMMKGPDDDGPAAVWTFHGWRKLLDALPGETYAKQEAFARTLVVNGVPAATRDLKQHFRAILGALARLSMRTCPQIPLDPLLREFMTYRFSTDLKEHEVVSPSWIYSCTVFMWDRRFFTSSRGAMGLAPDTALEGDVICIPLGCSEPMILRPADGFFTVVGPAYLDGMMYGEAMALLESGEPELQEFKLH